MNLLISMGRLGRKAVILLLILAPLISSARIIHRFGSVEEFGFVREAANRLIPGDALVMVEDDTPAVRLYQLNRKGWPLRNGVEFDEVRDLVVAGGKFLITNDPVDSRSTPWTSLISPQMFRIGSLYCYPVATSDQVDTVAYGN